MSSPAMRRAVGSTRADCFAADTNLLTDLQERARCIQGGSGVLRRSSSVRAVTPTEGTAIG